MEVNYGTDKTKELIEKGILKKDKVKTMKIQANMKKKIGHTIDEQQLLYQPFVKG